MVFPINQNKSSIFYKVKGEGVKGRFFPSKDFTFL